MLSRDGSLLPSSYVDVRYIDDFTVSKAFRITPCPLIMETVMGTVTILT